MNYSYSKAAKWLVIHLLLALIPLFIALSAALPQYRSFAIEAGVAMGFLGLGLLGLQFLFTGRFIQVAPSFGMDNLLQYHREIGIIAFIFILAHPIILIISDSEFLSYFNPTVNMPRAVTLAFVTIAIIILIASSLWRLRFGLSYERWRLVHGVLSLAVIGIGVVHSIQVAHYLSAMWQQILIAVIFALYAYLIIHTRLVRPWLSKRKPWEVTAVTPERDECWTLELKPVHHKGLQFACGQFVWLTLGPTPFSLQQHPFSIASVCGEPTIKLTAKASGDFTSTWKDIQPGTRAYLEGPFGSFTPVKTKHLFLIMGGIGITPTMSMLRTMVKDNDPRQAILIYANPDWEGVTFREELDEIARKIKLRLVHVLENPPDNWKGETGMITLDLLQKYLPENPNEFAYYICGPKPMQDAAELAIRDLGIDWRKVYSERFQII